MNGGPISVSQTVALRAYMELKTKLVAEAGGPADPVAMLEWHRGGSMAVTPVPTPSLLHVYVAALREVQGPADEVIFCSDTFARVQTPGEGHPGDLRARLEAGDMTVREQLVIMAVTAEGASTVYVRYGYDDQGAVVFEPVDLEAHEAGGRVYDALRRAVAS